MVTRECVGLMVVMWLCAFNTPYAFTGMLWAATPAENLLKQPDVWFSSAEAEQKLAHVLAWQTNNGDWPKNVDTTGPLKTRKGQPAEGTFDNGATTGELRLLAKATRITTKSAYQAAFMRGLDLLLRAQYANGGWPQFYPPGDKYHRHITFNDNSMVRLMTLLRDVGSDGEFDFVDSTRRQQALQAVERGVECIIRCQVIVAGQPTVWCAQHDAQTMLPAQARAYELPSLSGAESAGLLQFLMTIDKPTPEVITAVKSGVAWLEQSKIQGWRYEKENAASPLTKDPNAKPLWARFYEISSNRPIFSDRDGVVKYDLNEIGVERRTGYAWYGTWGNNVLKAYSRWPHR